MSISTRITFTQLDPKWAEPIDRILEPSGAQAASAESSAIKYGQYGRLYAFTTENIGGYMPAVSRSGMSVLSVAASGDHLLNAIYLGAHTATVFDLNGFALFWTELKLVAAARLSFREFQTFFFRELSESPMAVEVYRNLRLGLRPEAMRFFDGVYQKFSLDGSALRRSRLFYDQNDNDRQALISNPYLSSHRAFGILQHRLKDVSVGFVQSCVTRLEQRLASSSFDLVLFSNISDYLTDLGLGERSAVETINRYAREIVAPFVDHLAGNGRICAAYVYCMRGEARSKSSGPPSAFHCMTARRIAFDQLGLRMGEIVVASVFPREQDLVCVVERATGAA